MADTVSTLRLQPFRVKFVDDGGYITRQWWEWLAAQLKAAQNTETQQIDTDTNVASGAVGQFGSAQAQINESRYDTLAAQVSGLSQKVQDLESQISGIPPCQSLEGYLSRISVGTFTRDISTASGNQSVTGTGFRPRIVFLFGGENATAKASWGFDDGIAGRSVNARGLVSADTFRTSGTTGIFFVQALADTYSGEVASMDSDGFTISWTKTGSPTGTATVNYLAIG